jgi:hypothetical protein
MTHSGKKSAYARFCEAAKAAERVGLREEIVLERLADIVDLLDDVVPSEQPPTGEKPPLDITVLHGEAPSMLHEDHAVAVVALPSDAPTELGLPEGSTVVAAVTARGRLVRLVQPPSDDDDEHAWQRDMEWPLEDFDPVSDRILTVFSTFHARIFKRSLEVVVVVRREQNVRVYLCAFRENSGAAVKTHGEHVPAWLSVCPVSLPLGHDPFEARSVQWQVPDARAIAAALVNRDWVNAYAVLPESGDGVEGDAVACFDPFARIALQRRKSDDGKVGELGLLVLAAHQTVQYRTAKREQENGIEKVAIPHHAFVRYRR